MQLGRARAREPTVVVGRRAVVHVDGRIAELAERQGGVIARAQLVSLGLTRGAIAHRAAAGRLVRIHRGVYAIGGAVLGTRGQAFGALLAGGQRAVLSHRSAAAEWRISPAPAIPEITVAGGRPHRRPGLEVHGVARLPAADVRERVGLTLTAPARTLLDLAAVDPLEAVERALSEAQVLGLTTRQDVRAAAARAPGHHGTRALLRALDGPNGAPTDSRLARAMLDLIRTAGLPRPRVDVAIAGHRVDFAWPERHLIVETDGWRAHGHRLAFERDRARDAAHAVAGWTVVRFTWRQVVEQPLRVAAQLGLLLGGSALA